MKTAVLVAANFVHVVDDGVVLQFTHLFRPDKNFTVFLSDADKPFSARKCKAFTDAVTRLVVK